MDNVCQENHAEKKDSAIQIVNAALVSIVQVIMMALNQEIVNKVQAVKKKVNAKAIKIAARDINV